MPSSNGKTKESEMPSLCPPTSGHLMAEKMRLGRQDQEETESGTVIIAQHLNMSVTICRLDAILFNNNQLECPINCTFFVFLNKAEKKSPKKPHRFSSCLPDSQELMEIKNKKKVPYHSSQKHLEEIHRINCLLTRINRLKMYTFVVVLNQQGQLHM